MSTQSVVVGLVHAHTKTGGGGRDTDPGRAQMRLDPSWRGCHRATCVTQMRTHRDRVGRQEAEYGLQLYYRDVGGARRRARTGLRGAHDGARVPQFGGRERPCGHPPHTSRRSQWGHCKDEPGHDDSMRSSGDLNLVRLNIQMLFREPNLASMRREAGGQW